ncbi:DUF1232 domain-containing protein [bacterium]|nr:DUF1232 domain-containing protein [bacterium]
MIGFKRLFVEGVRHPIGVVRFVRHLPHFAKLFFRLLQDPRVPKRLKLLVAGVLVYVISPVDLLPDLIIPLAGYIDDLFVLSLGLKYFLKKCPPEVVTEHVYRIERGD